GPAHKNRTRGTTATRRRLPQPQQRTFSDPLAIIPRLMEFRDRASWRTPPRARLSHEEPGTAVPTGRLCRRGRWQPDESLCRHFQQWAQRSRSVLSWCWMTVPRGRKERRLLLRVTPIPRAKRRQNLLWMCSGGRGGLPFGDTSDFEEQKKGLIAPTLSPQRLRETEFVTIRVGQVEEPLAPFGVTRRRVRAIAGRAHARMKRVAVGMV